MKNAIKNLLCFAVVSLIFALGAANAIPAFASLAGIAVAMAGWIFLALLPYLEKGAK